MRRVLLSISLIAATLLAPGFAHAANRIPQTTAMTAQHVIIGCLSANAVLRTCRVRATHTRSYEQDGVITPVYSETYEYRLLRRADGADRIVWAGADVDAGALPSHAMMSIDIDGLLKSSEDYAVDLVDVRSSAEGTYYVVQMRHAQARLTDGRRPVIELSVAADNGMVYEYRLSAMATDETVATATFAYDEIGGAWLPTRVVTRLPATGDVFVNVLDYADVETNQ